MFQTGMRAQRRDAESAEKARRTQNRAAESGRIHTWIARIPANLLWFSLRFLCDLCVSALKNTTCLFPAASGNGPPLGWRSPHDSDPGFRSGSQLGGGGLGWHGKDDGAGEP